MSKENCALTSQLFADVMPFSTCKHLIKLSQHILSRTLKAAATHDWLLLPVAFQALAPHLIQ